jgi:hypothetical protein
VQHWQCSLCGLRVQRTDLSQCANSSGRLLQVHDWQDAFELARKDGVLTWEYESRDQFLQLQDDIKFAGWEVDKVEEVRRSGGLFSRHKIVKATLRPQAKSAPVETSSEQAEARREEESPPELWRPREPEPAQNGDGNGHSNGNGHTNGNGYSHEYENGSTKFKQIESALPPEGDDLYESHPEVDDSAVYSAD